MEQGLVGTHVRCMLGYKKSNFSPFEHRERQSKASASLGKPLFSI